jgi:hypothetical protein
MTSDPRDQQSGPEFEQELEVVHSAWSGLEQTDPPELLNQAVLNTARRELDARRRSRPLRWLGGFATATVIVLALTIVIQQEEQQTTPALKKTNGFMLDQATPAPSKSEADPDDLEEKAGHEQATRQLTLKNDEKTELRVKRSVAAPATPAADAAVMAVAEEMSDSPAEPATASDRIPEADAWIERLLLLRETQQDEKLVQELAAFRDAYPDYVLPPELQN